MVIPASLGALLTHPADRADPGAASVEHALTTPSDRARPIDLAQVLAERRQIPIAGAVP